ncbi:MAG: PAS domain S-box protein [Phycisphaerales bacterium JB050]
MTPASRDTHNSIRSQQPKQSPPHRRLQNLYVVLFLVLGAALCGSEVLRQQQIQNQIAVADYTDSLREQGARTGELGMRAMTFWDSKESHSTIIDELDQRIATIKSVHHQLMEAIDAHTNLTPESTAPIRNITDTLDEIQSVIDTADAPAIAEKVPLLAQQYRQGLQQAAASSFQQNRLIAHSLAYSSLVLFCVIAGLLVVQAMFLILPATTSLRNQWNRLVASHRDRARLSDRFRELIDSVSAIREIRPTQPHAPGHSDHEDHSLLDLEELHAVEAGLRLLEAAVVNSRDGILIVECNHEYRVVFCNDTAVLIFQRPREEIIGRTPWDLHAAESDSAQRLRTATQTHSHATLELRMDRPDGQTIHTRVDIVPIGSGPHGPSHVVLSYRDITERILAERALNDSLDRFELIGRITLEGIYDLNLETGRCWRNEHLIRTFGNPEDNGTDFFDWLHTRLHPDDADRTIASIRNFIRSDRSSWEKEYRQLRADGTWAYVRDRATLLRDSHGKPHRLVGSMEDLTEIRQQQWVIEQNNEMLQKILDDQTELVCRYDLDFTLTFINQAYAEYFERERDDLIGTPFTDLIPEEDRGRVIDSYKHLSPENPTETVEHPVTLADGRVRWQRWINRVILDADQQVIAYQAVGRDVTEEINAKRELEQAESRYRAFVRNSSEAIFRIEFVPPIESELSPEQQARLMLDRGVIAEVNDAFSRQYGRENASDSIGLTLRDLFGDEPESIAKNLLAMENMVRRNYVVDDLISHEVRTDGSTAIFSNNTVGIVEDNKLVRVWGTQRDITGLLRAEQELRKTNTLLELFIEHAPAAVAMFDREMCYISASRRWVHDYALEGQPLLGRSHYEVFPEIGEEWKRIHEQCMSGQAMRREEDAFVRADGTTQWIRWDVRPWYDDAGQIGGIMMFTEEITERKLAADNLREVNAQQERLLTELDHRVKNALGGLLSLIEMGTHEQTDVQTYAASIARRVRSMASVHAMLSESRWKPLDLNEIVKVVTPADTPGKIVPDGPPVEVPAHQATPLAMILQEFVSNSMKYGALSVHEASVYITWQAEPAERQNEILLRITWREQGGPPVEPDPKEGIGSQLIRGFARFELRGSIEFDFSRPDGVLHTLTCRLSEKH